MHLSGPEILRAVRKHGSERAAARALGIPRTTFQEAHWKAKDEVFSEPKFVRRDKLRARVLPKRGKGQVTRYILSSVQDTTEVHEGFVENLEAYAEHIGATILIAGFTYNKSLFEDHSKRKAVFHARIAPYLTNERVELSPSIIFCGEVNISPATVNPLAGFETYTRSAWGVFPHPRVCMRSVATMFREPAKQIFTTGAVSLTNYIPKAAGFRAEFHHVIGALIVEITPDDEVFVRQLIAEDSGSFQDLGTRVAGGMVYENQKVEAITWGDIHLEQIDPLVKVGAWKYPMSMLDRLAPSYQFMHDTLDFKARNHHNVRDPHHTFARFVNMDDGVEKAIEDCAKFLDETSRPWCQTVVVESNHDLMLKRWLKEGDYKNDPANAVFFLKLQLAMYQAILDGADPFSPFEHAVRQVLPLREIIFLDESDSFRICGDIENGLHGHRGANGAKGSMLSFAKMGPKANVAHTHSCGIYEGIYCAGTSSKLDMGYNRGGLSSWSHTHIVTYASGKRTLVTMVDGAWSAAEYMARKKNK